MSRGETYTIGSERVAKNGYHYVKTAEGWRLKHHIIAEETLGRTIDTKIERICFIDHNCNNFDPANIEVVLKKGITKAARKAQLESKIEELQAQLDDLEEVS